MLLLLAIALLSPLTQARMQVLHSWKQLDFTFPNDSAREQSLASGQFIPKKTVIIDVDVWKGSQNSTGKMFVTVPSLKSRTPATLATVTDTTLNDTTLLRPYPDWSWHQGDCDGITSVFRVAVDKCGRLWVLDTGVVEAFSSFKRKCPPQILVFDLNTDELIRRHRFPDSALECSSLLITVAVDTREDCASSVAYVADVEGYALLVYDLAEDRSWRVASPLFYPDPLHGDFYVNGVHFQLMDGVFGLALGPVVGGDRTLYFHSLASLRECRVSTSVLRNHSLFVEDPAAAASAFLLLPEARRSPAAAHAISARGVLLFSLPQDNAIGCWDTRLPYDHRHLDIATKDDTRLQFQSGLKIHGDYVFTVSNRLQNYIVNQVAEDEVNIRVNIGRVSDLIRNSVCDVDKKPEKRPSKWAAPFDGMKKMG